MAKKITKRELSKSLKQNTTVMKAGFEKYGYEVGKICIRPYDPDEDDTSDYDGKLFVELTSNGEAEDSHELKVVYFDSDDDILLMKDVRIDCDFVGYDVIQMDLCFDSNFLKCAVSGKVFIK